MFTGFTGRDFPGDTNKLLKVVQFRLYGEMVGALFRQTRDRYLDACRLVQIDTELANQLRSMESADCWARPNFEPRTLEHPHDRIAAWFRFSQDDGGQLLLGESEQAYEDRLADQWRIFFEQEVRRLITDDEIARAVLVAAAFANSDRGYTAQTQLCEILKKRYYPVKQ